MAPPGSPNIGPPVLYGIPLVRPDIGSSSIYGGSSPHGLLTPPWGLPHREPGYSCPMWGSSSLGAPHTSLDSNIENLQRRTQQLIEKINENRKKDHTVMSNFRESLMLKVSSLAEKLEEMMFLIYDRHNKQMQDKLQELSEIMERISQIQTELRQVCHTVEAAYKDLCVQPEVPDCQELGVEHFEQKIWSYM
uniref:Synaptonemal complex central element protein 2 n=1 Tax=Chrysemys picta bellii TaxID=8478 RepID=A0A8C3IIR6_CHRPI